MSAELQIDEAADGSLDDDRLNVSGDLPTVLGAAPMFRRSVAGYDRFQVDTYVQWAEDELATADREREHLLARHLETRAALDDARQLLAHSPGGGEFLQVSRHVGSLLAAAADEAETMRAEAAADRVAASAELARAADDAQRTRADAVTAAERTVAGAAGEAAGLLAEAARVVDEAEQARRAARAEVEARLHEMRLAERRAAEQAERIRQDAVEEAAAARLRARHDIVAMLTTAREERRRVDAAAIAARDRLDREAVTRRAVLLREVDELERRLVALRTDVASAAPAARPSGALLRSVRRHLGFARPTPLPRG